MGQLTFLLRAQSECSPLATQLPTEKMDEDFALRSPAVIGIWKRLLVVNLYRRKHMVGGLRRVRSCTCAGYPRSFLEAHGLQVYCPVRPMRGRICQRVQAGERPFLPWTGHMFTNRLRNLAALFGHESARRFGAHSVRVGAARSISESGGTCPQILRAG